MISESRIAHPTWRVTSIAELAKALRGDPARFEQVQKGLCCSGVIAWHAGQRADLLARTAQGLSVGAVSEPVALGEAVFIAKRVDPPREPPRPPRLFELPQPSAPDVESLARTVMGVGVQRLALRIGAVALQRLKLDERRGRLLQELHVRVGRAYAATVPSSERESAVSEFFSSLRSLLNDSEYSAYRTVAEEMVASYLMQR